jgi:hypothetical protein
MKLSRIVLAAYIAALATVGVVSYLHPSIAPVLLVIWIGCAVCGITVTGLWLVLRESKEALR